MWKAIIFIIGILLGISVIVIIVPELKVNEEVVNTLDQVQDVADIRSAQLIIKEVELAYTNAYMGNMGYPTLQQVKNSFSSNESHWTDDYVIQAPNFNCDVKINNNNLKVTCLEAETTTSMILSN